MHDPTVLAKCASSSDGLETNHELYDADLGYLPTDEDPVEASSGLPCASSSPVLLSIALFSFDSTAPDISDGEPSTAPCSEVRMLSCSMVSYTADSSPSIRDLSAVE